MENVPINKIDGIICSRRIQYLKILEIVNYKSAIKIIGAVLHKIICTWAICTIYLSAYNKYICKQCYQ